jgi:hypothetical protein
MKTRILASSSLLVGVLFTMASGCAAGEMPDAGMDAPGRDAPFVERVDADLDTVVPIDAPTEPQDAWMGDAGSVAWPVRSCEQTIRYARGGSRVEVAGDFNGWTRRAMSDVDGDGVFEIALGTADGLRAGEVHAYKLIVDDTWIIDPESSMRRYDGACINSAFRAPACTSGPEIVVTEPVAVSFDGATELASVTTELELRLASDGALPRSVSFTLDGTAVPATLDARGHYTVSLRDVPIGRHLLAVRATDAMDREAEPVDLPFWVEARPWSWRDAVMYMIVVDRFANGDRTDDRPVGAPVEYPADFHGGDLEGILEVMRSGYFEELGVNVLWLSPINQQAEGHFAGRDDGHEYAGYHGYWPSRARDVEPRFGGNEALRALVDEAHRRGIRVLFDLINNQIHTQHEYFGPHPEWFRTGCVCGQDPGCGWSERPLDCLFASYLPDINWRVPDAEEQFVADAIHWVDAFGIDGFRIDAVKHVETSSIYNLRTALHRRFEQGGERLYLVGETAVGQWDSADYGCGESFANGYGWIDAYVGEYGLDGQFDFPLPSPHAVRPGHRHDVVHGPRGRRARHGDALSPRGPARALPRHARLEPHREPRRDEPRGGLPLGRRRLVQHARLDAHGRRDLRPNPPCLHGPVRDARDSVPLLRRRDRDRRRQRPRQSARHGLDGRALQRGDGRSNERDGRAGGAA